MSGAIVAVGAGAVVGGLAGWAGSEMMGDSAVSGVGIPKFQEPEYYTDMQDLLASFGKDVLKGDMPEYYQALTEPGSPEFERYLDRVLGETKSGVLESAARVNQRGGAVGETMARAVGDVSSKMRYKDLLRALQGRGNMLNLGLNTLSGVRQSDLSYTDLVNQFGLNRTNLLLGKAQAEDAYQAQKAQMVAGGISSGAKLGSSIWGYGQLSDAMAQGGTSLNSGLGSAGYLDYQPLSYSGPSFNQYGSLLR